jgi:signal transduction histidine kinase
VKILVGRLRRPDPLVYVIAALLTAAGLVVYLQHRALMALDRQTGLILQKISEQTAAAAAVEIRRTFEAPVFEILTAVNHPVLQAGRLDLVTDHYAKGLDDYPQVERFFLWNAQTEARAPGEVLFYVRRADRPPHTTTVLGGFHRDPSLGRAIHAMAERYGASQQIYAAVEHRDGTRRYDVFLRLFWIDARRDRYFAVLGFVVNLEIVRTRLFGELHRTRLGPLFNPTDGSPRLEMRILDEGGRPVLAPPGPIPALAGRAQFALQFYPAEDIGSRMAAEIPARIWTVMVSPVTRDAPAALASTRTQGYWLSGLSVLLMFVALAFALQGQKRASQLARMQADFMSHVSHQLKTPLALLSGVSETLALDRARSPERMARYLDIMRSETAHLSALVERILQFSRVDGGKRRYELESVSLVPLVRETVEAFAQNLTAEGFAIRVEEGDASPVVAADPAALEQVLVNLLDNAVKYSDRVKDITVRVTRSGSDALIEVTDRGIGIPAADIGRVFEKFYRGSGSTLHRHGFGLGLAIALELVRAHRGRIEVQSVPGEGSVFRVRLPVLHDSPAQAAVAGRAEASHGATAAAAQADPHAARPL